MVGMADTMSLKSQTSDAAINRRISILVLNKSAQHNIEHENSESQEMDFSNPAAMKQWSEGGAVNLAPQASPVQTSPLAPMNDHIITTTPTEKR